MATFSVNVCGFAEERFDAATKAKAMYLAYRAFCETGRNWDFHRFITLTRIYEVKR